MKTLKLIIPSIAFLLIASCGLAQETNGNASKSQDKLLMAVSWYQHSAEMKALYYQGFNIAKQRLDEAVAANKDGKHLAVVVDIDETMLDNSPFEASLMMNTEFKQGWKDWTNKASAKALPGTLEFTQYAKSKDVEIFYITNRDDSERIPTLKNLQSVGFPFATEDHLYTKSDLSETTGNTSSKEGRRAKVAKDHEIILLMGDNLNDFSMMFEDRSVNDGKDAVEKNREKFGQRFIILPNPMYGAWEKPLYNYNDKLSDEEKTKLYKEKLIKQ